MNQLHQLEYELLLSSVLGEFFLKWATLVYQIYLL